MLKKRKSTQEKRGKGVIVRLRESRTFRGLTICLAMNLLFETVHPTISWALTEGPSQPEVQSFEPVGTTQMVDLFSGDFNYNIPLFNLPGPNGGYPVNLAYHAGVSMEDEASWVGLGWNINVGSLVRNMRGLPDEFESKMKLDENGFLTDEVDESFDYLDVKSDIKESWTLGVNKSNKKELFGGKIDIELGRSLSVYYNNFTGIGASLTVSKSGNLGKKAHPFNFGLSLDPENGAGVSAEYTHSIAKANRLEDHNHSLRIGFNGSVSLDYDFSTSRSIWERDQVVRKIPGAGSVGSSVTFARNSFTPSISNSYNSYSLSLGISGGKETKGFFTSNKVSVFYNQQDLDNEEKKGKKHPVIGYSKAGKNNSKEFTRDFIRSNDGQVTKDSKFLAYSQYAYDAYQSTGQGLVGYFRSRRADIGKSFDPQRVNSTFGFSASLEYSRQIVMDENGDFVPSEDLKWGGDMAGSFGSNKVGSWENDNDASSLEFKNPTSAGINENMFYQFHGEQTVLAPRELDHIGGTECAPARLVKVDLDEPVLNGKWGLTALDGISFSEYGNIENEYRQPSERVVRNTLVHSLNNDEVAKLGEFDIKYFNNYQQTTSNSPSESLDRTARNSVNIGGHPAGYKVLNGEGNYYVYALPAYNKVDIENIFSVEMPGDPDEKRTVDYQLEDGEVDYKVGTDNLSNSHKFINKTAKSPYAHSYLLTSVQGADYVDITNNGPSDDDLGYWVKFNYTKYDSNYMWRAPYNAAMYSQGQVFTSEDDKGSYRYGEKEVWYLGQVETKSHIAVFEMSERNDLLEAAGEHSLDTREKNALRVDKIHVYEKRAFLANGANAVPLQTVHFEYDYSLCQETTNSNASSKGKLTLKKVYFTSNGSRRGELTKYEFDYGNAPLSNPDYSEGAQDGWGMYRPITSQYGFHANFPYTQQFNQNWSTNDMIEPNYTGNADNDKQLTKEYNGELASAWCLKSIKLPSGGVINIEYESDDYGYVQHKTANQMFKIHKMGDYSDQVGASTVGFDRLEYDNANVERRIYFKLEEPIPAGTANVGEIIYDKYVRPMIRDEKGQRNLYFKSRMRLTSDVWDYVSGYLPLEEYLSSYYGAIADGGSDLVYGYVTVKEGLQRERNNGQEVYFNQYHPMSLVAWTYMQTNASKLLQNPNSLQNEGNYDSPMELAGKLVDLLNIIPQTAQNFGAIRAYCKAKKMAKYIDLDRSVIRLASPDKIKYGGGHRVKQITISDEWSSTTDGEESSRTYGQVYDYTTVEDGQTISSGVAQYEPQPIGDENALKYPIYHFGKVNAVTRNNLFTEAPINEDLFPGSSVGYRKVSVRSLNTNTQMNRQTAGNTNNPPEGRTGGISVNEFYTSKEFPTRVDWSDLKEENDTKDVFNVPIPIPLIGTITRNYFHGSQAYWIELNDMHGKPKSVKSYELNNYTINSEPITSTTYEYQTSSGLYDDESIQTVDSYVDIIKNDGSHKIDPEQRLLGVSYDMYTDQREWKSSSTTAGAEFNTDLTAILPFPIPSVWPSFSNNKSMMRTFVTNKVIHRTGILKKVITQDIQASNTAEYVAYDEKSGQPIVTKSTNDFGDELFSYNIPAYYAYERMGHAYQNINYNFTTLIQSDQTDHFHGDNLLKFTPTQENIDHLVRGDELLLSRLGYEAIGSEVEYSFTNPNRPNDPPIVGVFQFGDQYGYIDENGNVVLLDIVFTVINGEQVATLTDEDGVVITGLLPSVNNNGNGWVPCTQSDFNKCYFLGWKYDENNTAVYGILSFLEPLSCNSTGARYITDLKVIRSGHRNHYGTMAASYLTKGSINEDNLGSTILRTGTPNITTPTISALKTLSASASLFTDNWSSNYKSNDLSIGDPDRQTVERDVNPFISGNSGIFRPYKSYSYVGERKYSADLLYDPTGTNDPDLRNDGVFTNTLKMFSWELGNMEDYDPNWEWVNEVTRYSNDSYETENSNRLDIHSTALYGYDNSLSIAVGGNASYHEIAFDDFETASTDPVDPWSSELRQEQNNFNFYKITPDKDFVIISETNEIKEAVYEGNTDYLEFIIENPSDAVISHFQNAVYSGGSRDVQSTFGLSLRNEAEASTTSDWNDSYFLNGSCESANYSGNQLTVKIKPYMHCFAEADQNPQVHALPIGSRLHGKVTTYLKRPMVSSGGTLTNVDAVATKAHTGKQSMKVLGQVVYDHPKVLMLKNKTYYLSAWVSRDDDKVQSYEPTIGPDLIVPGVMTNGVFANLTNYTIDYSKVIEGWQKVDVEFTLDSDDQVLALKFNPGAQAMYFDDIRFAPKTGGIMTYVYDPDKFWLRATLNVDNYATLYFYDESGNLHIKKQETEEGIFTITESRSHLAEPEIGELNGNQNQSN